MNSRTLEDAENRFGEVMRLALAGQPQRVACNDREAVVVISAAEYARLAPAQNLFEFPRASPLAEAIAAGEVELDSGRASDLPRDIDLG